MRKWNGLNGIIPPPPLPTINQLKEGFAIFDDQTKAAQRLENIPSTLTLVLVFCS
jgi:hypothetical protein